MGQSVAKLQEALRLKTPVKQVLLVGDNGSGKTCLLYGLKLGFGSVTTIPTIGFNVETVRHRLQEFTIWDLGLRTKMRPLVRHYVPQMEMLIYMVDASDRTMHNEFSLELWGYLRNAMEEYGKDTVPCLIFINKLDQPNGMNIAEIAEGLNLSDLAKKAPVRMQPCDALSGQGVLEGLDFLTTVAKGELGLTIAATSPSGYLKESPNSELPAAKPAPPTAKQFHAEELDDQQFLEAFVDQSLGHFGVREMMRLALIQRLEGSSALATLEAARLKGYVEHATRMHFWAARMYSVPLLQPVRDTRTFLTEHCELLPVTVAEQESLLKKVYSERIDTEPTWAATVVPPDLADDDQAFLARIEGAGIYTGELDSFASLLRLGFLLLKASPRREAIQRMDSMLHRFEPERPYHETRQYVALQLAHLALTKHPRLKDEPFYKLEELCPDLCQEDCISKYYSEKVLAQGQSSFQAPDRQPLPTKLESAASRWHQDLDDQDFLKAVQSKTLSSWNLPSLARLAYLHLNALGRRQAVRKLLDELQELRRAPEVQTGLFTHETLAYFTIHMIHYFSATEKLSTSEPFSEFIKKCDKILDASLYKAYYSEGTIHCPEAATSFVLPDLCPLPDLLPSDR
ncbi:unnamed protein product [Durusdinium trenchii]|uniref:ADP-ribosylation factor n=1 Tax=Durusdinium trenchii TaxID=1381693 RepID=A0ABP0MWV7_9DINO